MNSTNERKKTNNRGKWRMREGWMGGGQTVGGQGMLGGGFLSPWCTCRPQFCKHTCAHKVKNITCTTFPEQLTRQTNVVTSEWKQALNSDLTPWPQKKRPPVDSSQWFIVFVFFYQCIECLHCKLKFSLFIIIIIFRYYFFSNWTLLDEGHKKFRVCLKLFCVETDLRINFPQKKDTSSHLC